MIVEFYGKGATIIASFLILIAVILSILTIVSLLAWLWRDGDGVLFPGLGLIVSMPAIIVFLLILNIVFVIAVAVIKPRPSVVNEARLKQNFEYPDDIFGGCGNGVLDLSVAKDPDNYDSNTDRALKVCINDNDLAAIHDFVIPGRIKYENLEKNEDFQKADEQNRKLLQNFAAEYPILGRIDDMYQDYVFSPEEVRKLRDECLKLQAKKPDSATDLALRKLIYACDEALKDNFYLTFSSD